MILRPTPTFEFELRWRTISHSNRREAAFQHSFSDRNCSRDCQFLRESFLRVSSGHGRDWVWSARIIALICTKRMRGSRQYVLNDPGVHRNCCGDYKSIPEVVEDITLPVSLRASWETCA